jgi:hypothetical protein
LAGALLFVEKIPQKDTLFWFGLRDVEILQIFYSRAIIQRTIVDFPAFSEHGLRFVPKQTVIRTSRRLDSFLYEAAQNFEVFLKN